VDPELRIQNADMTISESVDVIMRRLKREGVLVGAPTLAHGLPYPDGDELVDLHVTGSKRTSLMAEVTSGKMPKVLLSDIDVNWLQTVAEGWAAPLKGFMREGALLQTLHFNSILVDPQDLTGNKLIHEKPTDFVNFGTVPPKRVSMSVPIVLPITDYTKLLIETSGSHTVALVNKYGVILGVMRRPEVYANRKEEIVSRLYGAVDPGHPYIAHIYHGGDWLLGGEIELLDRIRYEDGLDKHRLTAVELMKAFEAKGADAVYAFQTRNPTHAGHAYLMRTARELVKTKGYENPILWLSPLGGWTKSDDVPLDVRVRQHEAVIAENMLDQTTTVMAIWPAPMLYAGPTEVLFHAKSRRNAGATFFVAGRDPAGIKKSALADVDPDDDLYDGNHGRYVLHNSPGQSQLNILPFGQVYYDKRDHVMRAKDESRADDFISISGTKMRQLAASGAHFCDVSGGKALPSDLIAANCIPPGFMVKSGWDIVCAYYQDELSDKWIPYSVMRGNTAIAPSTRVEGELGMHSFHLHLTPGGKPASAWHDLDLFADESRGLYNLVVEIPMYSTAKLELNKGIAGNPIMQDVNKDGTQRFFTYGAPAFNYGLLPRTWEDSETANAADLKGDNDPLDVVELGGDPLPVGAVVPVKVLGLLELIDEGEIDYKVITLRASHPDAARIGSMKDLELLQPGVTAMLVHWFKFYKTSDGKPENTLVRDVPSSAADAINIIKETHEAYVGLKSDTARMSALGLV
jgi:3'-phosphoadenosine 5'-phosphosulfate synthase